MIRKKLYAAMAALILSSTVLTGCGGLFSLTGIAEKVEETMEKDKDKNKNKDEKKDVDVEEKEEKEEQKDREEDKTVRTDKNETTVESVSAKKLASDAVENSKYIKSVTMIRDIIMDAKVNKMDDYPIDADFSLKTNIKGDFCGEDESAYISGNLSVEVFAGTEKQEQEQKIDVYVTKENGQKVCYIYDNETGKYSKENYEFDPINDIKTCMDLYDAVGNGTTEGKLHNNTEMIGGKEAYAIDIVLPPGYMDVLKESLSIEDVDGTKDYSDINAVIYVYKDDHYPAGVEIDGEIIGDAVFKQATGTMDTKCDISTKRCDINMYFENINNVDSIKTPQSVIESAGGSNVQPEPQQPEIQIQPEPQGSQEPQTSSAGTAYLKQGNVSVTIRKPSIYGEIKNISDNFVSGKSTTSGEMLSGSYSINTWNNSPEEYINGELDTNWMKDYSGYSNVKVGQINTMNVNGMTVYYAKLIYDYESISCCNYCSCVQSGGALVVAEFDNSVTRGQEFAIDDSTVKDIWNNITLN